MNLQRILEDVRRGSRPDYEDLRLAVLVLDRLVSRELHRLTAEVGTEAYDEALDLYRQVLDAEVGQLVPWDEHPDNPEYQEQVQLVEAILKGRLH